MTIMKMYIMLIVTIRLNLMIMTIVIMPRRCGPAEGAETLDDVSAALRSALERYIVYSI